MAPKLSSDHKSLIWPDVKFHENHWVIFIQLYDKTRLMSIKPEWLRTYVDLPTSYNARYSVLSWQKDSKPTTGKAPTIIRHGKQGRNVLEQAIAECTHKHKKQKEKHDESKIPPMLLKVFDDYEPAYFEAMPEDFYIQRKYNGTRALAMLIKNKIVLYSRRLHIYNVPTVQAALLPYLAPTYMIEHFSQKCDAVKSSILLDGELYIHNTPLQTISGIVRGSDEDTKARLAYVIFDLFDTTAPNRIFSERQELIKQIFKNAKLPLILAPTYKLGKSRPIGEFLKRIADKYKDFLTEKYEGAVIRRDLPYEPAYHGKLSDTIFKHKPLPTAEFKIIGYTDGKGKDAGKIIWTCETRNHIEFSVRPKATDKERAELFKKFKSNPAVFKNNYEGKKLTIQYAELSTAGVPLQPRALIVRDYE